MTLDEVFEEFRKRAMVIVDEMERQYIETTVDLGVMSRAEAEASCAEQRPRVIEAMDDGLSAWREELRASRTVN
jgi:hypothetical protein